MQFSEAWLRSLVNPALDTAQLAHAVTMAGLEVEALAPAAPPFNNVVVAEILSAEKHPDADRLRVCQVDVGEAAPVTIVCGAPNAAAGLKVPCARPGAKLPGIEIKVAKVRGVESFGMLCSTKELGLEGAADGLMVLPDDAPVGEDFRSWLSLDDTLITLKLTPNRADCLSLAGLAREIGAITGAPVHLPQIAEVAPTIGDTVAVQVAAPDACPRYLARVVRGIDAQAQTPRWMAERLERSGIRPLLAPVDITNYVLLELGQPMHAFALSRLDGGIEVRLARAGETLELLNGQTAELAPDMLVIADATGPVALAGIMGGQPTSVEKFTVDLMLEAAFFAPAAIAGRARRLGLSTDSSHRFERGVDFGATRQAMERATQLLVDICGGQPGPVTEAVADLPKREPITLRLARLTRVAGVELDAGQVAAGLAALGAAVERRDDNLIVTPPSFRFDLAIEEDLIEEAVRLFGYDNIPAQPPAAPSRMLPQDEKVVAEDALRQTLVDLDYQEVVTYSFVDPAWETALDPAACPLPLANPIASQLSAMRTTLWGGLIETLRHNLNRQQDRVRVFELGRVYASLDAQPLKLGGLAYGDAAPEQWGTKARRVDFFDVKGDLERLFGRALDVRRGAHPALHPGQCAEVCAGGRAVGWVGTLHPRLVQAFDLPAAPVLFELDSEAVTRRALPRHGGLSRFPQVRRDLAFVLDAHTPAGELVDVLREAAASWVRTIDVFDEYRGKGVPENQKSLAIRVVMQDTERTLTDQEVEDAVQKLVDAALRQCNASLRA
ncbi:phenylalanine--tRNA ligase subunit beta [Thiobacillus sedimenti]|uniref:Phenylalanine--tRNA ligase beta subunit n=1 Tax=Thiobacillus sedimenti TaxID=3110231 RepID=A0ABZ1CG90_9PROT|nr:phenylalanine--tRNA ligase subunit beta [Thiobacillus sp. SCUT-2]WRS38005.1 phenylalanine--tRNA ligase subunit beta [Thiobacillus sp. SCUT-2]